jgi:hypothetical protein
VRERVKQFVQRIMPVVILLSSDCWLKVWTSYLEVQQVISGRKIFVVVLIEAFFEKFGPLTLFHKKLGRIKPGFTHSSY